ncbi:hypothetical protein THRCLA_20513 [Thraustotheca clavata]|uniref:CBM1 domain-containing protein n=1 Tax=Thraustotheca clavata TaxID=74557 RepID=A0A1W0A6E0_9STRA|nr:hypothetical protein THRCLA_20513 [Thraustotheca clavata]
MDFSFVSLALSGASALRDHLASTQHVLKTQANNYALPWQQCGGKHFHGHTKCTPGHICKHLNEWWSQCVPDPSLKGPPTYSQCGGMGFEGETTCREGDMCVVLSKYYSQCVPMVLPAQFKQKCINVNVLGDATYCIKGPVCGGEDDDGDKCPKKGDIAVGNCLSQLKSYIDFAKCVAPKDATCQVTEEGKSVCSFEKIFIKTSPPPTTIAPTTVAPTTGPPTTEPPTTAPPSTPAVTNGTESSTGDILLTPTLGNVTVGNETEPQLLITPTFVGNLTSDDNSTESTETPTIPTTIPINSIDNTTAELNTTTAPVRLVQNTTLAPFNSTDNSTTPSFLLPNTTTAPVIQIFRDNSTTTAPVDTIVAPNATIANITFAPSTEVVEYPNATIVPVANSTVNTSIPLTEEDITTPIATTVNASTVEVITIPTATTVVPADDVATAAPADEVIVPLATESSVNITINTTTATPTILPSYDVIVFPTEAPSNVSVDVNASLTEEVTTGPTVVPTNSSLSASDTETGSSVVITLPPTA